MKLEEQVIIPAARTIKDYERMLETNYRYIVLLDCPLAQLLNLIKLAKSREKEIIIHADLIQGLRPDEHGAQFLCQVVRPAGIISTHTSVIATAKKNRIPSIKRMFVLDAGALETSYRTLETVVPDYVEILPGVIPEMIEEMHKQVQVPILAGGLIRTPTDVETALRAGATAVTTSHRALWKQGC